MELVLRFSVTCGGCYTLACPLCNVGLFPMPYQLVLPLPLRRFAASLKLVYLNEKMWWTTYMRELGRATCVFSARFRNIDKIKGHM